MTELVHRTRPLDELAAELNLEHVACQTAMRAALDHALRCGELLIEAKAQVPHGHWQAWLAENFAGSDRTARAYAQLARQPKRQRVAGIGVREALRQLGDPTGAKAALGIPDEGTVSPAIPQPGEYVSLRSGVERKTWLNVLAAERRAHLKLEALRDARELLPEPWVELARGVIAKQREAADELELLVELVLKRRRR